jgi:alpha-amylase
MKIFTKLFVAFMLAMGALAAYAADHYVYYDGTLSSPSVWAWNDDENCTSSGAWPGDKMTKKDGKWYWELPAGKSLPTQIIISEGSDATKIGGGDLVYTDQATYHQDGSYTEFIDPAIPNVTAAPVSGTSFKSGEELEVTLVSSIEATIYYTTDGTEPTTASAIYSEPLVFTETTTLKTLAVSADGKQKAQTFSYSKMPAPGEQVSAPMLNTKYYKVNPNGQVGTSRTVDVEIDKTLGYRFKATNAMKNWTAKDIIAQGVARDVCQALKGKHERPIVDSYAIYAAYDDNNLYLGVQFVYTVWDQYGEGKQPGESKTYNANGRMMWAFDLSPVAQFDGYINGEAPIWNDDGTPGAKFQNGVDAIWIGSTQPGVGTPGFFTPTPDGHASYDGKYCKSHSSIMYGCYDGLLSDITNIYGQKNFEYTPSVLTGESGFADLKSETKNTDHTFYEWKFPLSVLGITKQYIEEYGIGVMYVDIYGSSPVGGTPYDPSYFDNAKASYSKDPSTSKEKEDEDKITYAPARIGKLLKPADPDQPGGGTPIEEVEAEDGPAEYYTISGVRVAEPVDGGVTIERRGSKVVKKIY